MNTETEVKKAIEVLEKHDYYCGNLWQIADVQHQFDCTDEEAYEVLDTILDGDDIISTINDRIIDVGMDQGLTVKKE